MGPATAARVDDLKRLSIIVAITLGLGGIAGGIYRAVVWAVGVQGQATAKTEHKEIKRSARRALENHALQCDAQHQAIVGTVKEDIQTLTEDSKQQRQWMA